MSSSGVSPLFKYGQCFKWWKNSKLVDDSRCFSTCANIEKGKEERSAITLVSCSLDPRRRPRCLAKAALSKDAQDITQRLFNDIKGGSGWDVEHLRTARFWTLTPPRVAVVPATFLNLGVFREMP